MIDLPTIQRKQRKASYKKPDAVKELEELAMQEARRLHPTCPHLSARTYRDDTSNSLTACIVKYITLRGGFASRINSTGIYNQKLHKYRPGTQKRGIADIISTYQGKSLHIEVKHGRDVQSEHQKKIESEVIKSGGLYFVAHTFTDFKIWFDSI